MINVEFREIPIQTGKRKMLRQYKEQCASENIPSVNICELVSKPIHKIY